MTVRALIGAFALSGLALAARAAPAVHQFGADGVIANCVAVASGFAFDVIPSADRPGPTTSRRERFTITGRLIPQAQVVKAVAGDPYRFDGPCPATGEQVRVRGTETQNCGGCDRRVDTVERGGHGGTFDAATSRLWITRQFFDNVSRPHGSLDAALFYTSQTIAHYNRRDGGRRGIWVRDHLQRALDTYSSANRAESMVQRFSQGRADLAVTTAHGLKAFRDHRDGVGLIKGIPYMPEDSRLPPFVGEWGVFAVEAYIEAEGQLRAIFKLP